MSYIRHEDKIIKIVDNYPIFDIEEKTDIQMEIRKVYKKAHILDMTTTSFQGMSADEVYRKAKAYDLLKEDLLINEKVFREQAENDEISDIIHGHYVALLVQAELESADDER